MARVTREITDYVTAFLKQGQALGLIRTDLPDELLVTWLQGLDRASDDWLLAHWGELDREAVAQISAATVEAMRHAVAPS